MSTPLSPHLPAGDRRLSSSVAVSYCLPRKFELEQARGRAGVLGSRGVGAAVLHRLRALLGGDRA